MELMESEESVEAQIQRLLDRYIPSKKSKWPVEYKASDPCVCGHYRSQHRNFYLTCDENCFCIRFDFLYGE